MTTPSLILTPAGTVELARPAGPRLTARRLVRSELMKLLTLRSTTVVASAALVTLVGGGVLAAAQTTATTPDATLGVVLAGTPFAVLVIAALGAVAGAREFGSGMIRTTLAAAPRRRQLVLAKAAALVAVLLPVALVGTLAAVALGSGLLPAGAAPSLGDATTLRVVAGTAAYLVGIGVLGLAIGLLVRSTAGAVATVIGAVMILPSVLTTMLPASWSGVLERLPAAAGEALLSPGHVDGVLSPLAGGADFLAWIVVALAGAAWALSRRDA